MRSEAGILSLGEIAARFPSGSQLLRPHAFLASVDPASWLPIAVVVSRGSRVLGVVYFKERKFAGFATGMVYGDATIRAAVLSHPQDRGAVFRAAVEAMLQRRGIDALRLLIPPEGPELEAIHFIGGTHAREAGTWNLDFAPGDNHWDLPLEPSYDAFLEKLGRRTRRNLRYYRRRVEQSGHQYVPHMDPKEFAAAAYELHAKSVVGANRKGLIRALKIFSAVDKPLLVGLRGPDGRWVSIIGGWFEPDSVMIFLQMNDDRDQASDSLSMVMRGYLIEDLIAAGTHVLRFWAGLGGPLHRYSAPVPAVNVFLDRRSIRWSSTRALASAVAPLFPNRMKWALDWIGDARRCQSRD